MTRAPMRSAAPVAVIGTGVIGASWAAAFLSRGFDVVAADPAPGAEQTLRRAVAAHWPALERLGLSAGAAPERLRFAATVEAAVADAGFVQENGPELLEVKRDLFARMDAAAPPDAILATSASTITVSEFQPACLRYPGRVVLGHPFNPPHLILWLRLAAARRRRRRAWSGRSHSTGRVGSTRSNCGRRCAAMSRTGCRRRCGRKPSTWCATVWRASPMWMPRSHTGRVCAGRCWGRS